MLHEPDTLNGKSLASNAWRTTLLPCVWIAEAVDRWHECIDDTDELRLILKELMIHKDGCLTCKLNMGMLKADRLFLAARRAAEHGDPETAERLRAQAEEMYRMMEEEAQDER